MSSFYANSLIVQKTCVYSPVPLGWRQWPLKGKWGMPVECQSCHPEWEAWSRRHEVSLWVWKLPRAGHHLSSWAGPGLQGGGGRRMKQKWIAHLGILLQLEKCECLTFILIIQLNYIADIFELRQLMDFNAATGKYSLGFANEQVPYFAAYYVETCLIIFDNMLLFSW